MNDNEPWPRIGQASRSQVIRALAHAAGWQLTEMPADLGLPLAGCLYNDKNDLLVAETNGPLVACIAAMDGALLRTRSDALIVSTRQGDVLPDLALGIWRSGQTTWHGLLSLWVGVDPGLWLVPSENGYDVTVASGVRLTAHHLRVEDAPWRTTAERAAGFTRAIGVLNDTVERASAPTGMKDRS